VVLSQSFLVSTDLRSCGDRILTLHLNFVAGNDTGPLLFLFERTYKYPVGNQGLLPWCLRGLGVSKVRSALLVTVLSDGKIPWVLLGNPPHPTAEENKKNV